MGMKATGALALCLLLAIRCLSAEPADKPSYESVLIKNVPHVHQKPDFCG
jgi:hypothetical protein